jgi:hypothetical protein
MSPTLLEGAIAILLVWIAWTIGTMLARRLSRRFKVREIPNDENDKKPPIIDV